MGRLDSVPAVRRIDTERPDLQAFDIVRHVNSADIENLFGLLEAAYALHPRIDVLVRLIDIEGVDWADADPDTIKQGKADARRHVRRCAIVGEPGAILASRGGLFLDADPIETSQFTPAEEDAAWAWLGSDSL